MALLFSFLISVITVSFTSQSDCDSFDQIARHTLFRDLTEKERSQWKSCHDYSASLQDFLNFVTQQEEFISRIVTVLRMELLQGTRREDLFEIIRDMDVIGISQKDKYQWAMDESARLYRVYNLEKKFLNDSLNIEDIFIACFDNSIYDQQNMGIHNYITSTFSYALGRPPTKSEFFNSRNMIEGKSSSLFFKNGNSKSDFLQILTHNPNFLERQVSYWYYHYFFSYPELHQLYSILLSLSEENENFTGIDIVRFILQRKFEP